MRIVKPSVKLIEQQNVYEHIAYCAKVCYATEKITDDVLFVKKLINSGHKSMLRHASIYFIITPYSVPEKSVEDIRFVNRYKDNVYSYVKEELQGSFVTYYITTNMQVIHDNDWYEDLLRAENFEPNNVNSTYNIFETGFNNMRYSFEVITQISTSRELNRVSPNNIAEQSTRYCNFSKDKFDNQITICQPHWFDIKGVDEYYVSINSVDEVLINAPDDIILPIKECDITINRYDLNKVERYLKRNKILSNEYIEDTSDNNVPMLAQDARGSLPLDLSTKCIYTYTIDEWRHIIDLRYYGTTGTPHPNAKIIAGMIRDQLISFGHEFK